MAQLYGPPSDGSVIPHELEDAIAADVADASSPIGASAKASTLAAKPVTLFDDFRRHETVTATREGWGEFGDTLTGQTWGVRGSADMVAHDLRIQGGVLRASATSYLEAKVGAPVTEMGADFVLDNEGGVRTGRGTIALINWLDLGAVNNKILNRGGWGRTPCHVTLNHRYLRVDYMDVFPNSPGAVVNIGTWELPTQLVQDGQTVHRIILSVDYDAHTVTVNVSGNAPIVVEHAGIALMPDAEDYFCVEPYYSAPATDSHVGVVRAWAKSYKSGEVSLVKPADPLLPALAAPIVGAPDAGPLPVATVSPDHWYIADRHSGADNALVGSWSDAVGNMHFAGFGGSATWTVNRDPEGAYLTGTGVSTERFEVAPTRNTEPVTVTALVRATTAANTDFVNLAGYKLIKQASGVVRLQDGTGSAGTRVDGGNIGAEWAVITAVLNGASSDLRVNGTSYGAGTLTGTATADSKMLLNGGWNVPADFAEIQVFDRALSTEEIDTVHAELVARSGLIA